MLMAAEIPSSYTSSTIPNACSDGDICTAGVLGQMLNNSGKVKCSDFHSSVFLLPIKSSINLHLLLAIQCYLYELCDYTLEA